MKYIYYAICVVFRAFFALVLMLFLLTIRPGILFIYDLIWNLKLRKTKLYWTIEEEYLLEDFKGLKKDFIGFVLHPGDKYEI